MVSACWSMWRAWWYHWNGSLTQAIAWPDDTIF